MALGSFTKAVTRPFRKKDAARLQKASELADGEFILNLAELLSDGIWPVPKEIEFWRGRLNGSRRQRSALLRCLVDDHMRRRARGEVICNPHDCWIMGTDRRLTPALWRERVEMLHLAEARREAPKPLAERSFKHSGIYDVSAIASLYKGGRYIETFLENITAQSIFDRSELIIIDADSPEGEGEVIAAYQKVYPNIVYKRMDYRIGVYDAWNVGVQMARGRYLTNTNLDDLRKDDSFELQADTLERNEWADVVYQDFFYSFDDRLSFEDVAKLGFKSAVPIVTPNNLLTFNSPHNAPMWRKSLHEPLGLFDTSFRSAGDWEFWMRCLSRGRRFVKINTPHIVYFQNPDGISTRPDTRGLEEGRRVLVRYARKLMSPRLLMSRHQFRECLGGAGWKRGISYYDVVQSRLRELGAQYKAQSASPPGTVQ